MRCVFSFPGRNLRPSSSLPWPSNAGHHHGSVFVCAVLTSMWKCFSPASLAPVNETSRKANRGDDRDVSPMWRSNTKWRHWSIFMKGASFYASRGDETGGIGSAHVLPFFTACSVWCSYTGRSTLQYPEHRAYREVLEKWVGFRYFHGARPVELCINCVCRVGVCKYPDPSYTPQFGRWRPCWYGVTRPRREKATATKLPGIKGMIMSVFSSSSRWIPFCLLCWVVYAVSALLSPYFAVPLGEKENDLRWKKWPQ